MTTASTVTYLPFRDNRFLQTCSVAMAVVLVASGVRPVDVTAWWLESALALVFLAVLAGTYRRLTLSDLSYLLILIFIALHEWGAHDIYASVPLGEWMKPWFGETRNHFDRVIHFAYGLLLGYPMQEWFMRSAGVCSGFRYFLPIQFTLACSAVYEILEAFMASRLAPGNGEEFVGMQGDMWDAQKDMFMAVAGATVAMAIVAIVRSRHAASAEMMRESGTPLRTKASGLKV